MPDFATIMGGIGAVTGAIALVVSIKSYVRVSAMKALDLRLELQKSFNDLDVVLSGVEAYLDYVHQSHQRVMAATGLNQSGAWQIFDQEFASDKARLRGLLSTQPRREADYGKSAPHELEKVVIAVHALRGQVADLRGKYQRVLEADDERRKEIRQQMERTS